jgi:hypothetical protein
MSHWTLSYAHIVGSVNINQANPNLAATAHLKRFMVLRQALQFLEIP